MLSVVVACVFFAFNVTGFDSDYELDLDMSDYSSDMDLDGSDPDFDYVLNPQDDAPTYLERDENGAPVLYTGIGTDDDEYVSIGESSEQEFDESLLDLLDNV